ncbi:MAG: hypothetical protein QOC62_4827 [Mycobacterium sp.]|jgi:hypothetical protein|nr:hypothetical protein [Mycobacterium sp.]
MGGDHANQIIAATPGLLRLASYRDPDVAIEIFAGPDRSASDDSARPSLPRHRIFARVAVSRSRRPLSPPPCMTPRPSPPRHRKRH